MGSTVDEAAPHNDAAVWFHGIGQHVGTVGMGTLIVEGTRLPLAIGFHQESAEVRNLLIDFLGLRLPPGFHLSIHGVGGLQRLTSVDTFGTNRHRRAEVDGEVHLDTVGAQDVGNILYLIYINGSEHLRRSIDVVQHRTVDAYRGVGTGVVLDQFAVDWLGLPLVWRAPGLRVLQGPEDAQSGIAAFNRAIKVIPVVQDAQFVERLRGASLAAQQGVGAVHQSLLGLGAHGAAADDVALVVADRRVDHQLCLAAAIVLAQLVGGYTFGSRHLSLVHFVVAQPEAAAVLGHCHTTEQHCCQQ